MVHWLKKAIGIIFFIFAFYIIFFLYSDKSLTNSNGAPPGYTGSPSDGNDCSLCHPHDNITPDTVNWVSSDIPPQGFDHTMMYNFSVSVPDTGVKGFELSVQDIDGNMVGYFISGTNSQIVGSGKYITHLAPDTLNPGIWNFQWAPGGMGYASTSVYAAFTVDSNRCYRQEIKLTETPCTYCHWSVNEFSSLNDGFTVTPADQSINVSWHSAAVEFVDISVYSLSGILLFSQPKYQQHIGLNRLQIRTDYLKSGIYIVCLYNTMGSFTSKVIL